MSKEVQLEASTLLGSGVMVFCLLASSSPFCSGSKLNIPTLAAHNHAIIGSNQPFFFSSFFVVQTSQITLKERFLPKA